MVQPFNPNFRPNVPQQNMQPGMMPGMMPGMQPGMMPGMMPGFQPGVQPGMAPPSAAFQAGRPSLREESYIENILRLNIGNPGTFHFSFERAITAGTNTIAVKGTVVAAGRDHVIIRQASTNHDFLFLMIYFDYAEFEGEIKYFPQGTRL